MKSLTRVVALSLGCLFVVFAALQYNDPDAGTWMSIYLFAAGYCGVAIFHLPPARLSLALAGVAILAAAAIWPPEWVGLVNEGDASQAAERAREAIGLLIVAAALALLVLAGRWRSTIGH